MEIEIAIEELRKRKIFVATPMYGGMCAGMYTKSTADLAILTTTYKIETRFYYLFNESLIPEDVLSLAALAEPGSDYEIVCGPYPKKTIAWEKIKMAVDKGFADKDPNALENYVGDYVFNPTGDQREIRIDQPAEVLEGGTGFMMIQRSAFDKFAKTYPQQSYKPDHIRTDAFDGTREIMAFFDCVIDPKTKRYLSEDYMFCQWAREAGIKVWMCPWMKMQHMGSYNFSGSLADLATLGAPATADPSMLKRKTAKSNVPNSPIAKPKRKRRGKKK